MSVLVLAINKWSKLNFVIWIGKNNLRRLKFAYD